MSPVHDHYKKHKKSLIEYEHRRKMVEHATQDSWITCSAWEGLSLARIWFGIRLILARSVRVLAVILNRTSTF